MNFIERRRALLGGRVFLCSIESELNQKGNSDGYSGVMHILKNGKEDEKYFREGESFCFGERDFIELYFNAQYIYKGKIIVDGETVLEGNGILRHRIYPESNIRVFQREADEEGYLYILEVERDE